MILNIFCCSSVVAACNQLNKYDFISNRVDTPPAIYLRIGQPTNQPINPLPPWLGFPFFGFCRSPRVHCWPLCSIISHKARGECQEQTKLDGSTSPGNGAPGASLIAGEDNGATCARPCAKTNNMEGPRLSNMMGVHVLS